ncbi:phosphate ABC transporter permease PstA [Streptomyces sp. NPDC090994]|uniref:phosphate ABC transporter permease PstA n=1 Tax=Streptomyces sp. NPDC090994 TaxID=3365969 RepID=UPI00381DCB97
MTVAPEAPGARRAPRPPRTTLPGPRRTTDPGGERRRTLGSLRDTDVYAVLGALAAALSLTWLLFRWLLPFDGVVGFVVMAYGFFLLLYALLVSFDESGPAVVDRIAAAVVRSMGLLMVAILAVVVVYALVEGRKALVHLNFFTQDMELAGPLEPLSVGGALHAAAGTLIMIVLALVITVPLGLVCAVFLNEVPGTFARFVRTIVEAMTALPSIVAGLFVYATVILGIGMDQSGLAASLALSVMMLPIIIRAADVVIRLVPGTLREAAYAMGTSRWRTAWHVVLPTCRSGLTTSVILGTARGIGETSPVLLTAGFTSEMNLDPLSGPMVSLPLATFEFVKSPEPTMVSRGFGTASLLMVMVLLLFVAARVLGGRGPGQLTRRQEHRRVTASRRDARRYAERAGRAVPGAPVAGASAPGASGSAGTRTRRTRKGRSS